ncbi:uncharacterized protein LOC110455118 [Mizuhopecten yessoensis]|uniref:Uncharacterized protein n=1 Tax=Mizuhopecten yessoensis TaxID=6573 RepID=A0A210QDN6_MIZYE|nr:uncharacterized protein LOC110455118 [Mizuhopecten yessoensis]OWF46860.1 hypothetical protein KP79_PYT07103 [Mizuhopecten yessoensis]
MFRLMAGLVVLGRVWGATMAPPSPNVPPRRQLDPANLDSLNRQVRMALLTKVTTELESSKTHMASLQPQLTDCQKHVNNSLGHCLKCVDNACLEKFKQCHSLTFNMQSPGGMSVSSNNVNGQSQVTVCALTSGQFTRTCSTIMNPAGFMVNSISQIGNNLRINLGRVYGDLGNTVVGNFVGGLTNVANNVVRNMTDAEKAQLQQTMAHLSQSLSTMGHHIGQGVQQSMNQMQSNLGHMNQNMQNFGQSMSQWGQNFGQQLSQSLSHMFDGSFLGRRRRATQECTFLFGDLHQNCASLTSQCSSCPSNRDETMEAVCGKDLVDRVKAVQKSMDEMNQIYEEVINAQNIITKVEFDDVMIDPTMASYGNVHIMANIRGIPTMFTMNTVLQLHDIAASGTPIAQQVWKEWAVRMTTP